MANAKCKHEKIKQTSPDYCYSHSVAVHPYTEENRAAHGCITYTEECQECGAQRAVNQNQGFFEYGPFGPDRATRRTRAERSAAKERHALDAEALEAARDARVVDPNAHQAEIDGTDRYVLIDIDDRGPQWCWMPDIIAAARQTDNGDGLVPFYRGVELLVGRALKAAQ